MPAKKEKVILENVSIEKILDNNFVNLFKKEFGNDAIPIGIIFISRLIPIIVNHEDQNEVDNRIVHINSQDEQLIEKIVKVFEQVKKE